MPTMTARVQFIPAGFETRPRRTTAGEVFTVVEGECEVEIGGELFIASPRDVIVVPSWTPVRWRPGSDLVLFSFSDRTLQEKLCLYRESCE